MAIIAFTVILVLMISIMLFTFSVEGIASDSVAEKRYEKGMESVHGSGAKLLEEKYGAKVLTVVSGDDITHAIRQGIV